MKRIFSIVLTLVLVMTVIPVRLSADAAVQAMWPVDSEYTTISTYFDESRNYSSYGHNAIDIPADYYSDIYSPIDGECVSAGWMGDYGNLIILWHESLGVYTFYAHCTDMTVWPGKIVNAGDVIGHVGNTGNSYGYHLHFGICDTLLGGYPDPTYYDPLTYFTYDFPDKECNCTEDYAGIYVTKGVDTYLNIRSGHSSGSSVVGQIYPNTDITVTKANGTWAHVEYNGISGYCYMEYIEKKSEDPEIPEIPEQPTEPGVVPPNSIVTISGANMPDIIIPYGKTFKLRGTISSDIPITNVVGGIYTLEDMTPICVYEDSPNTLTFELSGDFDNAMTFNELKEGTYIYRVEAESASGRFRLIDRIFEVRDNLITGDLNGDSSVTIADAVILEKFLLNDSEVSEIVSANADLNDDGRTDVFDMVIMRKMITGK